MPTGRAILLILLLSFPLALSHWVPALVWVTVLGDALVALFWAYDWERLRAVQGVQATRDCQDTFSLGVANPVRLRLRSRVALGLHLTVVDDCPQAFGFGAGEAEGQLLPHGEWVHEYHLTPDRRGDYDLGKLHVRFRTGLGLASVQRAYDLQHSVRVYPNVAQLRQYELLARRDRLALLGLHRLRLPAAATEFDSLRDYLPDDEMRRVEWNATARRGKLVVKEYDVERMQTVLIAVDCGRTMASRLEGLSKLDHAINASVLLTHVAGSNEDRVGMMAFADEVLAYLPPGKGKHQAPRVTDFLYPLHPRTVESDYQTAFVTIAAKRLHRAVLIVFTDLVDPDSSSRLLRHLPPLARRHQVLCVALSDYELDQELRRPPEDAEQMFRQVMAKSVQEDRNRAIAGLTGRGVVVLNASPGDLSVATVNAYLAIKARGG